MGWDSILTTPHRKKDFGPPPYEICGQNFFQPTHRKSMLYFRNSCHSCGLHTRPSHPKLHEILNVFLNPYLCWMEYLHTTGNTKDKVFSALDNCTCEQSHYCYDDNRHYPPHACDSCVTEWQQDNPLDELSSWGEEAVGYAHNKYRIHCDYRMPIPACLAGFGPYVMDVEELPF